MAIEKKFNKWDGVPYIERWWSRVYVTPLCWLWTGTLSSYGYGRMSFGKGKSDLAHRISYEHYRGPIPEGMQLDHICRNRACVHPWHLQPVSIRENVLRGVGISAQNARKTHCKRGHKLSADNVYLHKGHRFCIACRKAGYESTNAKKRLKRLLGRGTR